MVAVSFRTVNVVLLIVVPKVPEIATEVSAATCWALIAKVAVVAPAANVTFAGTFKAVGFALDRATTVPFGAGPLRVTVPTAGSPPNIPKRLTGLADIEVNVDGGTTVCRVVSFVN